MEFLLGFLCNLISKISACEISLFAERSNGINFTFARSDDSTPFKRSYIHSQVDSHPLERDAAAAQARVLGVERFQGAMLGAIYRWAALPCITWKSPHSALSL
jgi:hypothetical protein